MEMITVIGWAFTAAISAFFAFIALAFVAAIIIAALEFARGGFK